MLNRRSWLGSLLLSAAALMAFPVHAADEAPEVLVKRLSDEVMAAIKADPAIQAGEIDRIVALVDTKIMPNVNFARMTSSAVGRFWRQATPATARTSPSNSALAEGREARHLNRRARRRRVRRRSNLLSLW